MAPLTKFVIFALGLQQSQKIKKPCQPSRIRHCHQKQVSIVLICWKGMPLKSSFTRSEKTFLRMAAALCQKDWLFNKKILILDFSKRFTKRSLPPRPTSWWSKCNFVKWRRAVVPNPFSYREPLKKENSRTQWVLRSHNP